MRYDRHECILLQGRLRDRHGMAVQGQGQAGPHICVRLAHRGGIDAISLSGDCVVTLYLASLTLVFNARNVIVVDRANPMSAICQNQILFTHHRSSGAFIDLILCKCCYSEG